MVALYGIEPLTAALGRSYTSIKVAQQDFNLGKEFKTVNGQYINKAELTRMGIIMIDFRYGAGSRQKDCLLVQSEKRAAKVLAAKEDADAKNS